MKKLNILLVTTFFLLGLGGGSNLDGLGEGSRTQIMAGLGDGGNRICFIKGLGDGGSIFGLGEGNKIQLIEGLGDGGKIIGLKDDDKLIT